MAIPAAPYASAATRPRPSKKPPAAMTGMSTASTTWGSSSVVATEPVWPPPSPPCTITASTPHAATFSAWRRAPIDGTTRDARVLQRLDLAFVRRERERRDLHLFPDQQRRRVRSRPRRRRAGSRRTAGRCALSPRGSPLASWSYVIVAEARMPSAPASAVALDEPRPGDPTHTRSARSARRCRTDRRSACATGRVEPRHGFGTSCSPRPFGSMRTRIHSTSSSVGSRDVGDVGVDRRARIRSRRRRRRRSRPGAPTVGACGGRGSRSRARRDW